MDITEKLMATLHHMDTHKDFNESAAVMNVVEAIQTIKSLRKAICIYVREEVHQDDLNLFDVDNADEKAIDWFIAEYSDKNYS